MKIHIIFFALFVSSTLLAEDIDRIQVKIRTSKARYSGTDDPVTIKLNHRNQTILDYPQDDFEIGSEFTYDLRTAGVETLSDIEYIRISKTGENEWRLDRLVLYINGNQVFEKIWAEGYVLDNEPSEDRLRVTLLPAELHKETWSIAYTGDARQSIHRNELSLRLTGLIGSIMKETAGANSSSILWKGKAIVLSYLDDKTIKVECFIKKKTSNFVMFNYSDISFSFLMRLDCAGPGASSTRIVHLARNGDLDYRRHSPVFNSFPDRLGALLTPSDCAGVRCSRDCDVLFR